MLFTYINNSDRSADVTASSVKITNEIQRRATSCELEVFQNTKPSENQDLKIYKGDTILSQTGATIVLNGYYQTGIGMFYPGQKLFIGINDADQERVEVLTYTEATKTIILTAIPSGTFTGDEQIGELIFGGVVSRVKDKNIKDLSNLEYELECVDYTKIFDKKLVSDTWEDVDSRYVINSFVNSTVNYNTTLDVIDYTNTTALRAEWIESGDGNNPTLDTINYIEGDSSGIFDWTNAGGTATFSASPTSTNLQILTGAASGAPSSGEVMLWVKTSDQANITSIELCIGSDSSNYTKVTLPTLTSSTDFQYLHAELEDGVETGTPDWTAVDYIAIIVTETGNGDITCNGFRINADKSFTLYNIEPTDVFDDLRSPQLKPTKLIQQLAQTWGFVWYIDFEKDIHFVNTENENAPFQLGDTTNNFTDLEIEVDQSQLGNRVIVRGGEKTSTSTYSQIFEGSGDLREWVLKAKFNNLIITIDDGSSTDTCEAGTTTTTINATGHNLSAGDHIVNRTRSNAVREVLSTPTADQFTVDAITGQVNTDTFSKFDTTKTDGIEGIDADTSYDYMYNSNEKSVRATASETTLVTGEFIRFAYNERVPIQVQYSDTASQNAMKALGFGDGIFDLDPITDRNIEDLATAISLADAKVSTYSNPLILGGFRTDKCGLNAGQVIHIADTVRGIEEDYIIQRVVHKLVGGEYQDYFYFSITFGTTLFGIVEFFQKLLSTQDRIELNIDDIVETYVTPEETVESTDVNSLAETNLVSNTEITESNDVNIVYDNDTWRWEPNGAGQTLTTRWGLFDWN